MKTAIVTGADGFIGRHLIERLCQAGTEVWAVVHPESPTKNIYVGRAHIHTLSAYLNELPEHKALLPECPAVFYHFAWQGVDATKRDDMELQFSNIELTLDCMRLAKSVGAKRFILPGSTNEYIEYGRPIDEHALPSPQNAYGSVKVALRYLGSNYAKQLGISFNYVVITGIYAADRRDNNVIFYVIDKLLRKEKPALTKLEQKWDYVHIDDVVEALYLIGEKGVAGRFYAVGHGDNQPLYKYIEEIHNCIDPTLPLGIGDVPYKSAKLISSCINLTALQHDTGFVPKVDFSDGIRRMISVIKQEIGQEKL